MLAPTQNTTHNKKPRRNIYLGLAALLFSPYCYASNSWTFAFIPQTWYGSYQDSLTRDAILSYGLFTSADYLEKGGVTFGYNRSSVSGKSGTADIVGPDIEEAAVFLSGHYSAFPDALPGKLTFRLDGYSVEDKSTITETTVIPGGGMGGNDRVMSTSTTYTDNIVAGLFQISFSNYVETYYVDIGYAASSYDYDAADVMRDNDVQQFTPTAGFAFNESSDWLQARAYIIRLQHGDNTNQKTSSNAVELQWTHWYQAQAFLGLDSIGINGVIGERISAVNPDAGEIYSLSDRQNSSISLVMSWQLDDSMELTALAGYDQYTDFLANESDTLTEDDYSVFYGYINFSIQW